MSHALVKATWLDASGDSGWIDLSSLLEKMPIPAYTIGFLIVEDENRVVVAGGKTQDGSYGSWDCIPKGMVQKIEYLDVREQRS